MTVFIFLSILFSFRLYDIFLFYVALQPAIFIFLIVYIFYQFYVLHSSCLLFCVTSEVCIPFLISLTILLIELLLVYLLYILTGYGPQLYLTAQILKLIQFTEMTINLPLHNHYP
jgi:hypothetical protein